MRRRNPIARAFKGRMEDLESKKKALRHMILHQEKNPESLLRRLETYKPDSPLDKTIVVKIAIEELTGKKSAEVDF